MCVSVTKLPLSSLHLVKGERCGYEVTVSVDLDQLGEVESCDSTLRSSSAWPFMLTPAWLSLPTSP